MKQNLVHKYNAEILKIVKSLNLSIPLQNVTLAVSGGSDSVFLALTLLSSKKPIIDLSTTRILHINHNWRGDESLKDQQFVEALAKRFNVPCDVYQVHPDLTSKESPELLARNQRKNIFANYELVLTGHNADDLYETVLWKTLQGQNPGVGIKVIHQNEFRPLLQFTKEEMQSVLQGAGESWCEDQTNHDGKLLRSKMRKELMPTLEKVFPHSKMTVVRNSLQEQINAFETATQFANYAR